MIRFATPPPRFPHPPDCPFARPTTFGENMQLIQYWVETNVASENPVKKRMMKNPVGVPAMDERNTAGTVRRQTVADARRGPVKSQAAPKARRAKIAPETDPTPALPVMIGKRN